MSEHGIDIVLKARDEASEKVGNVSRNFSLLTRGLTLGTAVKVGEYAAIAAYRMWGVEQEKVKGNYVGILQAELKLNDALRDTVRAIPIIGRGAAAMMEAFGNDEALKNSIKLFEHMQATIEQAKKDTEDMLFNAKILGMQNAGRPQSEIEAAQFERIGEGRGKSIEALKEELAVNQKNLQVMIEIENAAAKFKSAISDIPEGGYSPDVIGVEPDRQKSNLILSENAELQKQINDREDAFAEEQMVQAGRIYKVETEEKAKKQAAISKRFDWETDQEYKLSELKLGLIDNELEKQRQSIKLQYDEKIKAARDKGYDDSAIIEQQKVEEQLLDKGKVDWEKKQLDTIAEMEMGYIKDKTEREKAAINFKYDLAVRRAKELGMATDSIERQRAIALDQLGMGKSEKIQRNAMTEDRFMRYQGTSGAVQPYDYAQKTAAAAEKQVSQGERMINLLQRITDQTKSGSGGQGLTPSNWQ